MTKHCCENCSKWVLGSGLFSSYKCLDADEKPEYIELQMREDGHSCSYFEENKMTINGKRVIYNR
jgi:ribonuclease HIII